MSNNTIIAVAVTAAVGVFLAYKIFFSEKVPLKEKKTKENKEKKTKENNAEQEIKKPDVKDDDKGQANSDPNSPQTTAVVDTSSKAQKPVSAADSILHIADDFIVAKKRGDEEWISDKKVTNCMICDIKFTMVRR